MTQALDTSNTKTESADEKIKTIIAQFRNNTISQFHQIRTQRELGGDKELAKKKIAAEEAAAEVLQGLIFQQFQNPKNQKTMEAIAVDISGINDKNLQNPHYLRTLYKCSQSKTYMTNFDGVGVLEKTGACLLDIFISNNYKFTNSFAKKWAIYRADQD